MKRLCFMFVLLFFILGLVSGNFLLFAEEKKTDPQGKGVSGLYLSGSVVSINPEAKLMTVKGWRGNVTLDISNSTLKGFKDIKEISAGDKVKVRYTSFGIEINKVAKAKK